MKRDLSTSLDDWFAGHHKRRSEHRCTCWGCVWLRKHRGEPGTENAITAHRMIARRHDKYQASKRRALRKIA